MLTVLAIPLALAYLSHRYEETTAKNQAADARLRLYTELLTSREQADSGLRKDMFGKVLDTFMNPYTGETNLVVHDWNDPVIDTLTTVSHGSAGADEPSNGSVVRPPELFGDAVHFVSESFVRLANPLLRAKWPRESAADLLETSAFLRLAASHREMDSPGPSASSQTTRTTNGPWLPWMLMGDHPGHLVHQLGGAKLLGGYGELPQHVRSRVEAGRPEFAYAPRTAAGSSENSWTTYGRQRRPAPPH